MLDPKMNNMSRPLGNATYQDILDAPENMVAEIIHGTLYTHPRPAPKHSFSGSELGYELIGPFSRGKGGPGGWIILDEPEVHLGTDVLVPDIAGWRRENLPELPTEAYFKTAPDWVCEILSPSTRRYDLTDKLEIYAAHGVNHIWFVDPDAKTLQAYAIEGEQTILIATRRDNDPVCVAPFEAITINLSDLWADKLGA